MLAERGINALLVLRIAMLCFAFFVFLTVLIGVSYAVSFLLTRRSSRRMGTAVLPIAVRLVPHAGPMASDVESRANMLREAGYIEVGRFATDRPPHVTVVGFVAPDGSHSAVAARHAVHGAYIELTRRDVEGGAVSVGDIRLPLSKRPPWLRLISIPAATVEAMQSRLEAEPLIAPTIIHDAASFVTRFETMYRRAMQWAYTEGTLKSVDPKSVAKLTGVEADPDTVYWVRMRREEAKSG